MIIRHISETARWMAYARAMESERANPILHDPFSRRLAGIEGQEIAQLIGNEEMIARGIAVRTVIFDELIMKTVKREDVDLILNLGAGLDTRPWRLPLPDTLRWIDVDLPDILRFKAGVIGSEATSCKYEAVHADVTSMIARMKAFERYRDAQRVLVVSEGLLVYLSPAQVAKLALDLHDNAAIRWWLTDVTGPQALSMLQQVWGPMIKDAKFQFGPPDSVDFFDRHGWEEKSFQSAQEAARRMGRGNPASMLSRLLLSFSSAERREEFRRLSGIALLANKSTPTHRGF